MIVVPVQLSLIINYNNYCIIPVFFQSCHGLTSLMEGLILQSLPRLSTYCQNPSFSQSLNCPQVQFPVLQHFGLNRQSF